MKTMQTFPSVRSMVAAGAAVALVLAFVAIAGAATSNLEIPEGGLRKASLRVPAVEGPYKSIAVGLKYDPARLCVSLVKEGAGVPGSVGSVSDVDIDGNGPSTLHKLWFIWEAAADTTQTGEFAAVRFQALELPEGQDAVATAVSFDTVAVRDAKGEALEAAAAFENQLIIRQKRKISLLGVFEAEAG